MHQRIRLYIQEKGMKIKHVAEKAGIHPKRFYRLIDGSTRLDMDEYENICNALDVSPEYFFNQKFLESKKSEGGKTA